MLADNSLIPEIDQDPVVRLLMTGQARTAADAEEMYLDASFPEVIRLLESSMSNERLLKKSAPLT
jgi:hypothetical protein